MASQDRPLQLPTVCDALSRGAPGLGAGTGSTLSFPTTWITAFEVGASFITLMMLVIVQHTQGREQIATQRKLDELIRALPEAESRFMMLEEESDETIQAVEGHDQRITKHRYRNVWQVRNRGWTCAFDEQYERRRSKRSSAVPDYIKAEHSSFGVHCPGNSYHYLVGGNSMMTHAYSNAGGQHRSHFRRRNRASSSGS